MTTDAQATQNAVDLVMADATNDANAISAPIAPVPMSFPAILINPKTRVNQLKATNDGARRSSSPNSALIAGKGQGKRWVRRAENSAFGDNPHIIRPTKGDYELQLVSLTSTFPKPLPPSLPRVSSVPSPISVPLSQTLASSQAGRFSLSLRGIRRELRHRGNRAQVLVKRVEDAIQSWLNEGINNDCVYIIDEGNDGEQEAGIVEVERTQMQLVWRTRDKDGFCRWIVHCVARWHAVVSFSKDVPVAGKPGETERLTFLFRPNTRYPDPYGAALINTPTATDVDHSSQAFDSDSEYSELAASFSGMQLPTGKAILTTTQENVEVAPKGAEEGYDSESSYAMVDLADGEDNSVDPTPRARRTLPRFDSAMSTESTGVNFPATTTTTTATPNFNSMRQDFQRHVRSGSSPSRSPMRTTRRRNGSRRRSGAGAGSGVLPTPNFQPVGRHTSGVKGSFWTFVYA